MQEELEKVEINANDNIETNEMQEEMEKLKKAMHTEKMLKVQAINKLAEIVHRKDNLTRKDKKAESKASSAELRKKEKENRKLQLDLNTEKEKFNQMVSKFTKELQDLQVIDFFIIIETVYICSKHSGKTNIPSINIIIRYGFYFYLTFMTGGKC